MITEALQHCRGIGPKRLAQLHERGVRSWRDVVADPERLPAPLRDTLVQESRLSLEALERDDIGFFVERLAPQDKWRILAQYLDRTSFFDIETTGLDYDANITVIICWHRGELHTFVEHENLDDFLDLLDDVDLLASFNGSTFDVPRVVDAFHIPGLPCPHLDLRWLCHHRGLTGGLKNITRAIGTSRPADLRDVNGHMAVDWWWDWEKHGNAAAREQLIRYCAADVLLLVLLSQHLAERPSVHDDIWSLLPGANGANSESPPGDRIDGAHAAGFGAAGPTKLRARRRLRP